MIKNLLIVLMVFVTCNARGICFSDDDLARLEFSRYGEAYENESLSTRLNRLETDIFGMSQTGSVNDRLNLIAQMSESPMKNRIVMPQETYYPGVEQSKIKNFWNNFTSPFSTTSTMTGYTPSWNSSGYGYANNMYNREFLNFMNNQNNYCPYHNRYHNNNKYLNKNYHNSGFYNSNARIPHYHNNLHNHNQYRNYYNPYSSIPANIATRSSVHIIKD